MNKVFKAPQAIIKIHRKETQSTTKKKKKSFVVLCGFAVSFFACGVLLLFPSPAHAACTSPAGAASQTRYDFTANKMYYCDNTSWVDIGAGDNLGNHIASTVLRSDTNNTDDLGTSAIRWKNGWFAGTVTAGTFAGSGASLTTLNATQLTTGTVPAARLPAYTGDVTKAAGGTATTIANNAVTNAKIANATIVATAKLSATGTKNNTTFLRGDNTWAVPAAGGGSASCRLKVTRYTELHGGNTGGTSAYSSGGTERCAPRVGITNTGNDGDYEVGLTICIQCQ